MNQFDITQVHRLVDQLETEAKDIKQQVNSPGALKSHITKLNSIIGSLESQVQAAEKAGMNPVQQNNQIQ